MASTPAPARWWLYGNFLIGDLLMQTPAIRTLRATVPEAEIHYALGDPVSSAVLQGNRHLTQVHVMEQAPVTGDSVSSRFSLIDSDRLISMDAASAAHWGADRQKTIAHGFGALLGVEVDDLRYDYLMTPEEREQGRALARALGDGKPVVIIARHSHSCFSNLPAPAIANKCPDNTLWLEVADWLLDAGFLPVAIGSQREEQDERYAEWPGEKLYGHPLRTVAGLLAAAHATITVDNGIRHLTAAAGGNLYCIAGSESLEHIRCVPVRRDQRLLEEHRSLPSITARHIIDGAMPVVLPERASKR